MSYRVWIPTAMIVAMGAFSCSKEKEAKAPDQSLTPAAYEEVQHETQVETKALTVAAAPQAIAEARCEREQRCNQIGMDKPYASKEACLDAVKVTWQQELSARECPKGVNNDKLAACLQELRSEDCAARLDSLEYVVACNEHDICQH